MKKIDYTKTVTYRDCPELVVKVLYVLPNGSAVVATMDDNDQDAALFDPFGEWISSGIIDKPHFARSVQLSNLPEKTIDLELTVEETAMLVAVLNRVGGDYDTSPRRFLAAVQNKLPTVATYDYELMQDSIFFIADSLTGDWVPFLEEVKRELG